MATKKTGTNLSHSSSSPTSALLAKFEAYHKKTKVYTVTWKTKKGKKTSTDTLIALTVEAAEKLFKERNPHLIFISIK